MAAVLEEQQPDHDAILDWEGFHDGFDHFACGNGCHILTMTSFGVDDGRYDFPSSDSRCAATYSPTS